MEDKELQVLDIPLTGKMITSVDPIKIQPNDFRELTNLRPTDDSPKGIRGMTKINTSATSYKGIRTGYHFKKDQPTENHILVQTNDISAPATASRLIKSDGTASIPSQDTFSNFLTLDNNNQGFFAKAPGGTVAFCNSTKNYIWGGNESRCYGFIVFDPSNPDTLYDYTDLINNTLTDSANVAKMIIKDGGVDAYTTAYYAFENNYEDSTANARHLTNDTWSFTTDSAKLLMGSYSANGTDGRAHRDITGDAAFDFSGGTFTITMKYRCENLPVVRGLWRLYKDAKNYLELTQSAAGALTLSMFASSAEVIGTTGLTTPNGVIIANQKHTIEVGRDASNNWYIFVDGELKASTTDSSVPANDYTALHVGFAKVMYGIHGSIDEVKIDKGICRHTAPYAPMTSAFSSSSLCNVYIASTRPLKGIKTYIGTANASAATVSGTYWNGAWTALSNVTDNTASGGKTLAQTGTITWDDTQSDAKVKIINNQQYYWYNLIFAGIDAATTIYYCTVDAEIQTIKDIWDGTPRVCSSMMTYTTSYSDYTLNVYKNDYLALSTDTYVNISDMTSSQFMIFGFVERTMAIYLGLAEGYANTTASTVATIYYWNGSAWVSVGTLSDGTSQGGISLSRSGFISWDAPAPYLEYTWTPNNGTPLYYYKLAFNKTIDNTDSKIYLNYIAGVPAQRQLHSYKFPLFWQNRLFLCGDQSGRKNVITYSAMDTNCVFNGTDSGDIPIDGDDELMAGATLFTRFGGDVYDSAIVCKRTQTFLLDNDPDNASRYVYKTVSTNKGCVAPYTMRLCDISFDIATNIKKHVVIWLSDSGLIVFDGVSLGTISDTFRNIFDPLDPNYINKDYIEYSYGEFDASEQEYILVVPIGSTPTWKEIHYKLKQQSAFWVDRGTGKALRCMFPVEDARGNRYLYGGTNDGYIERLEYGTTMDGNGIAYTMWLPDIDFTRTALVKTKLEAIQLVGIAKSLTASTITVTHYIDGATTGTTLSSSISQASTGNRVYRVYIPMSGVETAVYHSVKITITTTEENRGYEPILVSFFWKSAGQVAY